MPTSLETQVRAIAQDYAYSYAESARGLAYSYTDYWVNQAYSYASYWINQGGGGVNTSSSYYWSGQHTFNYDVLHYGPTTFTSGATINVGGWGGATINFSSFGMGFTSYVNFMSGAYVSCAGSTWDFSGASVTGLSVGGSSSVDTSATYYWSNYHSFSSSVDFYGSTGFHYPTYFDSGATFNSQANFWGSVDFSASVSIGASGAAALTFGGYSSSTYMTGATVAFGGTGFGATVIAGESNWTFSGATVDFNGAAVSNILQSSVTNLIADLAGKQATLTSGTNIKTVGGNSLLGSGDIPFPGVSTSAAYAWTGGHTFNGSYAYFGNTSVERVKFGSYAYVDFTGASVSGLSSSAMPANVAKVDSQQTFTADQTIAQANTLSVSKLQSSDGFQAGYTRQAGYLHNFGFVLTGSKEDSSNTFYSRLELRGYGFGLSYSRNDTTGIAEAALRDEGMDNVQKLTLGTTPNYQAVVITDVTTFNSPVVFEQGASIAATQALKLNYFGTVTPAASGHTNITGYVLSGETYLPSVVNNTTGSINSIFQLSGADTYAMMQNTGTGTFSFVDRGMSNISKFSVGTNAGNDLLTVEGTGVTHNAVGKFTQGMDVVGSAAFRGGASVNFYEASTVMFGGSGGCSVTFSNGSVTFDGNTSYTFTNNPTISGSASWTGAQTFSWLQSANLFRVDATGLSVIFGGSTGTPTVAFTGLTQTTFESGARVTFGTGSYAYVNGTMNFSGGTALGIALTGVVGLETALNGKQATLVSGTNIKTVGGVTLLGSGDVPLPSPVLAIRTDATASTALASTDDYVIMTSGSPNAVTIGTSLTVGKTYYIKQAVGAGVTTLTFSGVTPNYSGFSGIAGTVARAGGVVSIIMTSSTTCDVFGDYA